MVLKTPAGRILDIGKRGAAGFHPAGERAAPQVDGRATGGVALRGSSRLVPPHKRDAVAATAAIDDIVAVVARARFEEEGVPIAGPDERVVAVGAIHRVAALVSVH